MKTAKEYRVQAAQALKGNYVAAIGLVIVYSLILNGLSTTIIGGILLGGALEIGSCIAFCNLFRNGKLNFGDLFEGFSRVSLGKSIGMYFKSALFCLLWSCLFLIPGIIKAYSYSMAPYILADHPEMTGGESITASKNLMNGKKWKLFCLEFSYIGWILLSILTCGILLLWVQPRMEAAIAAFYEDIKGEVNA